MEAWGGMGLMCAVESKHRYSYYNRTWQHPDPIKSHKTNKYTQEDTGRHRKTQEDTGRHRKTHESKLRITRNLHKVHMGITV